MAKGGSTGAGAVLTRLAAAAAATLLAVAAWASATLAQEQPASPAGQTCRAETFEREVARIRTIPAAGARVAPIQVLAADMAKCPYMPRVQAALQHLLAINYFDAGSTDGEWLLADLTAAAASNDRDRYLESAWRWAGLSPLHPQFFVVAQNTDALLAAVLREQGGALPAMPVEQVAGLSMISPQLCSSLVEAAAATGPEQRPGYVQAALACAARFGDAGRIARVVTGEAARPVPADPDAFNRLEFSLAYAARMGDAASLDAAVKRAEASSATSAAADRRSRLLASIAIARTAASDAVRGARAVALCYAGLDAASGAIEDERLGDSGQWCDIASRYLVVRGAGDPPVEAMKALERNLRRIRGRANPLLSLVADDLAARTPPDVGLSLGRKPDFDLLGASEALRRCRTIGTRTAARAFGRILVLKGGFTTSALQRELASCLRRTFLARPALFDPNTIDAALFYVQALPLTETAKLRIAGARALLLDPPVPAIPGFRMVVEGNLLPLANAPAGVVNDGLRRDAILLMLRAALDVGDVPAADGWRARLRQSGGDVPASLGEALPVVMPFHQNQATAADAAVGSVVSDWFKIHFQRKSDRDRAQDASYWQGLAASRATQSVPSVRAPAVAERLASVRTLVEASGTAGAVPPACRAAWLAQFEAAFRLLPDAENERVNALAPPSSQTRTFLETLRPVYDGFEPPNLQRDARDLSDAVADLELTIVVGVAAGDEPRVSAALALLEEVFATLPRASAGCVDQLSDIAYLSRPARDALLLMLARRGTRAPDAVATHLLAAALRTWERDEAAQALATGASFAALRREVDSVTRQVGIAKDALDVERTRSLQVRQVAAEEAFWTARSSTPVSSVEAVADQIRAARAGLADGEALFATLPVRQFTVGAEFVSVLVTRAGIQIVSAPAPEGWRDLRDGLDISGVRDAAGLPEFDVVLASKLYRATLGAFDSPLPQRLYVVAAPTEVPLGVLVSGFGSRFAASSYATATFVQEAHDLAYLGATMRVVRPPAPSASRPGHAQAILFAAPNYGPNVTALPFEVAAAVARHIGEPAPVGESTCGQGRLEAPIVAESPGQAVRLFTHDQASEATLRALDASGDLRQANVLAVYAHGVQARGGSRIHDRTRAIALSPTPGCDVLADDGGAPELDGFLVPDEITGLHLGSGALVVLAGCDTAQEGEVLNGSRLPEAFFTAGAAIVVGSAAEVPADSTAALTSELLKTIPADPVRQVSAAIRSIMETEPVGSKSHWRHPAYWGSWKAIMP